MWDNRSWSEPTFHNSPIPLLNTQNVIMHVRLIYSCIPTPSIYLMFCHICLSLFSHSFPSFQVGQLCQNRLVCGLGEREVCNEKSKQTVSFSKKSFLPLNLVL